MRPLLICVGMTILVYAFGQSGTKTKIRFDGFYQTIGEIHKENDDTSWSYLRFYPEGRVIGVASDGRANNVKMWFNLEMEYPSIGNYEIHGNRLYFSTKSKAGSVIYKGKIKDQYHITLKTKSLINGYKGRKKYKFIHIPEFK